MIVKTDCKTDGSIHSTSINCCSLTHWEITSPPCLPWLVVVVSRYRPFPGSAAYCCQQVCHALLASPASAATCPVMSPQPAPCTVQTMLETVCSECCSLLCYISTVYLLCSFSGSCSMYCGAGIQTGVYSTPSTSLASPAHACQVPASHTTVCILTLTHTSHIHQPIPTLTH